MLVVGGPWASLVLRLVWTEAWADFVRAGARVDGPRCDATSACVYIWFGVRLVGVFLAAAFWLRSSVVSVLISLISDTEYTVLLDINLIFS